MDDNGIDSHNVSGLGIGIDPNTIGFIVYCKTRTLCHMFYQWKIEDIIVFYINKIKIDKNMNQDSIVYHGLLLMLNQNKYFL